MTTQSPLFDAAFVKAVTGADTTDGARTTALIQVASDVARDVAGVDVLDPAKTRMNVKVALASWVGAALQETTDIRAESVGDYRVEYTKPGRLDVEALEATLARLGLKPVVQSVSLLPDYGPDEAGSFLCEVIAP